MSKPIDLQTATGIIVNVPGLGILFSHGIAKPADASAGYAKGCIFTDTTGGVLYYNEGTVLSCDFDAVTVA